MNLTAITEWKDVVQKHFIDSLCLIKSFSSFEEMKGFFSDKSIVDVGTGAGFPGIVLKILLPDLKVTLMDSLDKRVSFLKEVISKLELEKIEAIHGRVEDLARLDRYREAFDFSTARAVASLPVLTEYCIPFVKPDGFFIAYKSEKASEELELSSNAFSLLGCFCERKTDFLLPGTDSNRSILWIRKTESTKDKYPRKAGTPTKKPL